MGSGALVSLALRGVATEQYFFLHTRSIGSKVSIMNSEDLRARAQRKRQWATFIYFVVRILAVMHIYSLVPQTVSSIVAASACCLVIILSTEGIVRCERPRL